MRHTILPSGMLAPFDGPDVPILHPHNTAPISTLWPEWWPLLPRTPTPQPLPPPPKPWGLSREEEKAPDATTLPRPTDVKGCGRRIPVEEVPPLPPERTQPWARLTLVYG